MKPLNGEKTHPLSAHALQVLRDLAQAPKPWQEINPGVTNRLERENLISSEPMTSPYKTVRGTVPFAVITPEGRERIRHD